MRACKFKPVDAGWDRLPVGNKRQDFEEITLRPVQARPHLLLRNAAPCLKLCMQILHFITIQKTGLVTIHQVEKASFVAGGIYPNIDISACIHAWLHVNIRALSTASTAIEKREEHATMKQTD